MPSPDCYRKPNNYQFNSHSITNQPRRQRVTSGIQQMVRHFENWNPDCTFAQMAMVQKRNSDQTHASFSCDGHSYKIIFGSSHPKRVSIYIDDVRIGSIYLHNGVEDLDSDSLLLRKKMEQFITKYNGENGRNMREAHRADMVRFADNEIARKLKIKEKMEQAVKDIMIHIQ